MTDENARTQLNSLGSYTSSYTVEDLVTEFLGDQVDSFDVDGLADAWRKRLNEELTGTTIEIHGRDFYSAYPSPDDATELIKDAIRSVDLSDIVGDFEKLATPFAVGDNLDRASDDQLRTLIREYGWDSPWYGHDESDTLESVVRNRVPELSDLHKAIAASDKEDLKAARENNPGSIMMLTYRSEATKTAAADYRAAKLRWLDGAL